MGCAVAASRHWTNRAAGAIVYEELESASDLPSGWADVQQGGTYDRTTSTSHTARCTTFELTEPSKMRWMGFSPRLPTTIRSASFAASTMTVPGSPWPSIASASISPFREEPPRLLQIAPPVTDLRWVEMRSRLDTGSGMLFRGRHDDQTVGVPGAVGGALQSTLGGV
jgi:hypothetical protein